MDGSDPEVPAIVNKRPFLTTNPAPAGFITKYILCLTPLILILLSLIAIAIMYAIMDFVSQPLSGAMRMFLPDMSDVTAITILLIAPIGIFAFFAATGWILRFTEMWVGVVLSLGMSTVTGFVMVAWLPGLALSLVGFLQSGPWIFIPFTSGNHVLYLLSWISFFIQPYSVLSVLGILAWTEEFRRSIRYGISYEGVTIQGGVWMKQEHMIPHHQIGRVVMEQNLLGKISHTGTIIPVGTTQWGTETSIRGLGLGGQKDNIGVALGFAKARQEGSRRPLDCLYGIPEPEKVLAVFETLITRPAERGEMQVTYLKKIYDKL
jgi:hypothetical protein